MTDKKTINPGRHRAGITKLLRSQKGGEGSKKFLRPDEVRYTRQISQRYSGKHGWNHFLNIRTRTVQISNTVVELAVLYVYLIKTIDGGVG